MTDYFSSDAFVRLDPRDAGAAAERIAQLLDSPVADAETQAVGKARRQILDVYNPFAWCSRWVEQFYQPDAHVESLVIRSHKAFRPFPQGLFYRLRSGKRAD